MDGDSLVGRWAASEIDGWNVLVASNTAELPWVEIEGDAIVGNLGCNDFGGSFATEGNQVVTDDWTSEATACDGSDGSDLMESEVVITEVIGTDGGFDIHSETDLMVWIGNGHEIVFTRS